METEIQKNSPTKLKKYLIIFVALFLIGIGGFSYYKYSEYLRLVNLEVTLQQENAILQNKASEYDKLRNNISLETERCKSLLAQEQGVFADFTYCQQFVDFSEALEHKVK